MALDDTLGLTGTVIVEKYRVDQLVAEGGFALVYRATHLLWNRRVALKVFKALGEAAKANKDELLESFIREGALLAELSERTASICQARDVGMLQLRTGESIPFMVLEWLEGRSLEQVLEDERAQNVPPRTLDETMRLLEPVAEALALAHKLGVAHRDIKPANIFLLGDPRGPECAVKLLDFGIAKVVMDAQKTNLEAAMTTGTMTAFTPAYAAPEQFSRARGSTGTWTDTYALAVVMVECLVGRPTVEGDDFLQIAFAASNKDRRPTPGTFGVAVPPEVERFFTRALAVEINARYATAGELWSALREATGQSPMELSLPSQSGRSQVMASGRAPTEPAPRVPVASPVASPPGRPNKLAAAVIGVGGAMMLLAIAAASFFVFRRPASLGVGSGPATDAAEPSGSAVTVRSATPPASASALPREPPCPPGLLYIAGGQFFMGSDDGLPLEKPSHSVKLRPFCIGTYEVTTDEYVACSNAGKCKRAATTNEFPGITRHDRTVFDPQCNAQSVPRGRHPINCVDWEKADTYCRAQSPTGRLPTEAEWEFAARGPDGRKYPWGDEDPSSTYLNACGSECEAWGKAHNYPLTGMYTQDDGWPTTAPVGSFPAGKSRYGLMDVVGNVWEWVADWYAPYEAKSDVDPVGPKTGKARVIRGGAWNGAEPSWVRPTFRFMNDPAARSYGVGFRCAADPSGPPPG